jgi:hypothetical protein
MLHQLCKHQLASVHRWPPRSYASQGRRTRLPSSNRDQENLPLMRFSSIIYGRQQAKRWDTTDPKTRLITNYFATQHELEVYLQDCLKQKLSLQRRKRRWRDNAALMKFLKEL